jgi:hypothetical protein
MKGFVEASREEWTMDTPNDCRGAALWCASHSEEIVGLRLGLIGGTRKGPGRPMTRQQLELLRDGVEAQMRWAALHRGDQELMDLLRDESTRLSMMIGQYPPGITPQYRPGRRPTVPMEMIAPSGVTVGIGTR